MAMSRSLGGHIFLAAASVILGGVGFFVSATKEDGTETPAAKQQQLRERISVLETENAQLKRALEAALSTLSKTRKPSLAAPPSLSTVVQETVSGETEDIVNTKDAVPPLKDVVEDVRRGSSPPGMTISNGTSSSFDDDVNVRDSFLEVKKSGAVVDVAAMTRTFHSADEKDTTYCSKPKTLGRLGWFILGNVPIGGEDFSKHVGGLF